VIQVLKLERVFGGVHSSLCCTIISYVEALYTKGLLLKYLGSDQAGISMGQVHEGICALEDKVVIT
jgi:hypothetical protein